MSYVAPGTHLLIDFWGCSSNLQDMKIIEQAMRDAAHICGASVLEITLHSFGLDSGITGVAILAESHISIHTWPEIRYIALDVFMCGKCNPHDAIPLLKNAFRPEKFQVSEHKRGTLQAQ